MANNLDPQCCLSWLFSLLILIYFFYHQINIIVIFFVLRTQISNYWSGYMVSVDNNLFSCLRVHTNSISRCNHIFMKYVARYACVRKQNTSKKKRHTTIAQQNESVALLRSAILLMGAPTLFSLY